MTTLNGTIVADTVLPADTDNTFATHWSNFGKGGTHNVANVAARDAITAERRVAGMLCTVESPLKTYRLSADLVTWVEFTADPSGALVNTTLTITGATPASTALSLTASGATWTKTGDNGFLGTSNSVFLENESIDIRLNGVSQIKGSDAVYVTSTSFSLSTPIDPGDIIHIISLAG